MAAGQVMLSTVPRSYGPPLGSHAERQHPRQLKKHGRQYSVQLDVDDKPIDHADSEGEEAGKVLPPLPATGE